MNNSQTPTVVLVRDVDGNVTFLATPGVTVLQVEDHAPDDRVYRFAPRDDGAAIAALIADGPIGHKGDGKLSPSEIAEIEYMLVTG